MNWSDLIQQPLVITTGDGKVFTPLWKDGETSKDFNTAVFDYIDLPGSEIKRKQVKARQFPLVFWFQGADNIDQAAAFDLSANDPRAWNVKHPIYGNITGQPLKIGRNDHSYNVTEVTVDFWETITGTVTPQVNVSIPDVAATQCEDYTDASANDYAAKVNLQPADVSQATSLAQNINAQINKVLTATNYNDYLLASNEMFADINNLILAPTDAIVAIHAVLRQPAQFELALINRISLLQTVYNSFAALISASPTANNKAFFESNAGAVITAMAIATVNPIDGDYTTRTDIANASTALTALYSAYRASLDAAYVNLTDPLNNFSASNATQTALQTLVITTISNLNTLAFNAKQERVTTLDYDSNLIVLTHKYMGLDALDANLETFRTLNNIRNKELFQIKKGRQIKYLV